MFWKKKKHKKSARPKPKATVQPQKQIEEIPEMVESEKKEEIPKQKKNPPGKNLKKFWILRKNFSMCSNSFQAGIVHGIFGVTLLRCSPVRYRIPQIRSTMTNGKRYI